MKETTTDGQEIIVNTAGICACGKRIKNSGDSFLYRRYDNDGNVVYEVCPHGEVVVSKCKKFNPIP